MVNQMSKRTTNKTEKTRSSSCIVELADSERQKSSMSFKTGRFKEDKIANFIKLQVVRIAVKTS